MLIEIKNLHKTYGNGESLVQALKGVDLAIGKGEFTAVVGPSGCGKSTLLHILGAMDAPDGGEVILEGDSLKNMNSGKLTRLRLKRMGFVFQTFNLIPSISALENVMLPMKLCGMSGRAAREKAAGLLDRMGLSDRLNQLPTQLSGGQKQRTALARAIANDPAIVLADEPTGNLDSHNSEMVMDLLQTLNKEGNTIVMVTHNPALADRAGRVIHMKDGMVV